MKHWLSRRTSKPAQGIPPKIKDHVIIVGDGLNGRNLARVLGDRKIPYVVLDVNPDAVKAPGKDRGAMIYGDATNSRVLTQACFMFARVFVVAASDPFGARRIVQQARQLIPTLHIVAQTRSLRELQDPDEIGANDVVPARWKTIPTC